MASKKTTTTRTRTLKSTSGVQHQDAAPLSPLAATAQAKARKGARGGEQENPTPLIPKRLAYTYKPGLMSKHYNQLLQISRKHHMGFEPPADTGEYQTVKLVCLICELYKKQCADEECDEAVKACLPVREQNVAFMTHSMFVTMVGAIVARALEQASVDASDGEPTLDLLTNRYYVRKIVTHDSSKTSKIETAANSGIMAFFMEQDAEEKATKTRSGHPVGYNPHVNIKDTDGVLTAMANHGFRHHYIQNDHHPEHNGGASMSELAVIEAIVDGLACVLERSTFHDSASTWLCMYNVNRFRHKENHKLATCVLGALRQYITDADYSALITFRDAVHALTGTYVSWKPIKMTASVPCRADLQLLKKSKCLTLKN